MTAGPLIQLRDVRVRIAGQDVLAIDHLEIDRGERIALIGASGSGKTTLLRLIKGFVLPESGTVTVLGETLPIRHRGRRRAHHRRIGMVYQHFDLIGREDVIGNVMHGRLGHTSLWRSILQVFHPRDEAICLNAIQEVQLEDKLEQAVRTLSGGEKQRVAIARSLAQEPEVLLADEPVASLDPGLARSILDLLMDVCDAHNLTLLVSLHLPDLARKYARRMVALRDGRVLWDLPTGEVDDERIEEVYRNGHLPSGPRRMGEENDATDASPTLGSLGHPAAGG